MLTWPAVLCVVRRVSADPAACVPADWAFARAIAFMWVLPRAGLNCWVVIVSSDNKKMYFFQYCIKIVF